MPIYEYVCEDCNTRFEALRSMKDADAPIACKACRSDRTRRALSLCYCTGGESRSSGAGQSGCGGCSGGHCSTCAH